MPVPVTSSIAKSSGNAAPGASGSQPNARKTRVVRRRGRAHAAVHSDDDFEREACSDSDESEDDRSSVDSDLESEPGASVAPNGHGRAPVITPSTTQSPQTTDVDEPALKASGAEDSAVASGSVGAADGPFSSAIPSWSEMVASEDVNGVSDLPVIDFQDLNGDTPEHVAPKKSKKQGRPNMTRTSSAPASTPPPPASVDQQETVLEEDDDTASASAAHSPTRFTSAPPLRRPSGPTARQAYQQRLEKDPSFVPVVGEFWGHDDRLLGKELRSLSGWWRGRWQGHGRGRGMGGPSFRGRGHGGFYGSRGSPLAEYAEDAPDEEVAPIDRTWTHDGFEEMKRRDEARRTQQQQQQGGPPNRGGFGQFRGARGGFSPRGRGTFGRGSFAGSPTNPMRPRPVPFVSGNADRVWFLMKPERMWTKQHEGFLFIHLDPNMKPRPGVGQGYKVRLPGGEGTVIRAKPTQPNGTRQFEPQHAHAKSVGSEYSDTSLVVRLPGKHTQQAALPAGPSIPKRTSDIKSAVDAYLATAAPPVTMAGPSEPPAQVKLAQQSRLVPAPDFVPSGLAPPLNAPAPAQPTSGLDRQPPPHLSDDQAQESATAIAQPPRLEPLQIPSYTPPTPAPAPQAQASPAYGSPYHYPPTLPPGVALSQDGVPYEISTGRPVYIQPTAQPPPPGMYQPHQRPMMHAPAHFVPGHMHHHSTATSQDFMSMQTQAQAHSRGPSMAGFVDPSTGLPIFTPARQSNRIQIRAPTGQPVAVPASDGSETALGVFTEPSTAPAHASDQAQHMVETPPAMMAYNPYQHQHPQQPYYYPDHYTAAYQPYMEMQQYGYAQPPADAHPQQGAVYY